jgi:two-component system cell cycle response regulator
MCDLDHFKQINDVYGHAAGDEVLQQFVARAQKSIRSNSDWVARYGGEEFLAVLPETPFDGAMAVAEKIRSLISATPFATRGGQARVTASLGVVSTGPNGPDISLKIDEMIKTADECLYRAKSSGRDRSCGKELDMSLGLAAHA